MLTSLSTVGKKDGNKRKHRPPLARQELRGDSLCRASSFCFSALRIQWGCGCIRCHSPPFLSITVLEVYPQGSPCACAAPGQPTAATSSETRPGADRSSGDNASLHPPWPSLSHIPLSRRSMSQLPWRDGTSRPERSSATEGPEDPGFDGGKQGARQSQVLSDGEVD